MVCKNRGGCCTNIPTLLAWQIDNFFLGGGANIHIPLPPFVHNVWLQLLCILLIQQY